MVEGNLLVMSARRDHVHNGLSSRTPKSAPLSVERIFWVNETSGCLTLDGPDNMLAVLARPVFQPTSPRSSCHGRLGGNPLKVRVPLKPSMVLRTAAVSVVLLITGATTASAQEASEGSAVLAPDTDGTNGTQDGPAEIVVVGPSSTRSGGMQIMGPTLCEPGSTAYSASSVTKSGKVTTWHKHVKNDSTSETLSISTSNTASVTASASVGGTLSGSVAIKKIAEVSLGISTNFGLEGTLASTSSFTRSVTFASAGKWIVYAGVYTGKGTVTKSVCSASGSSITKSSGTASTFNKARTTGLVNCANSGSDLVFVNAKSKCG